MAALLYFGTDDRLIRIVEPFFKSRLEEAGESHSISVIKDEKKLEEVFVAVVFEVIFIEQNFLTLPVQDWKDSFYKKYPRVQSKMILVGDETDPLKVLKYLEQGWTDYIVNPPDKPIIIEKIGLYATGKRSRDIRQVFSLQMSQHVDLAKPGYIEELSEFDCKIRSSQPSPTDDLIVLYSTAFGENFSSIGNVIGRCYDSKPHEAFKNYFINSYFFVGVRPDVLQNIRTALRKSYVANKSKK